MKLKCQWWKIGNMKNNCKCMWAYQYEPSYGFIYMVATNADYGATKWVAINVDYGTTKWETRIMEAGADPGFSWGGSRFFHKVYGFLSAYFAIFLTKNCE